MQGDILDPGGAIATWSALTRRSVERAYGRWLTFLASTGRQHPECPPAAWATREAVTAYVAELRATIASTTAHTYLRDLRGALTILVPEEDWRWLRDVISRLNRAAAPSRDKRRRMVPVDELFVLGVALMTEADASADGLSLDRACQFRDGLIIALLAAPAAAAAQPCHDPIGQHLVRHGTGYLLCFAASETESRMPIEAPFPTELIPFLERYLAHHRPVLCQPSAHQREIRHPLQPVQLLWVSKRRTGLSPEAIYGAIVKWSTQRLGRPLSPHLFRDCAATSIASDDPDHVHITASILGHSSLATSERHYNHARSLEAARRYQENIAALRQRPRRSRH